MIGRGSINDLSVTRWSQNKKDDRRRTAENLVHLRVLLGFGFKELIAYPTTLFRSVCECVSKQQDSLVSLLTKL
jgi:hypothetical protein